MREDEQLGVDLILYRPIGVVRTPFTSLKGMPKQPFDAPGVRGIVEIAPAYRAGLADLEGFSHLLLLVHLHRSGEAKLVVGPPGDSVRRGVFATRNNQRPNPIGLSLVRLVHVAVDGLEVEELDLLDGTPLLDIKPYVPAFDARPAARIGWLSDRPELRQPPQADDAAAR